MLASTHSECMENFTDAIGRAIQKNDMVAVTRSGYASPTIGTVQGFTPKMVRVELLQDFHPKPGGAVRRSAGETFTAHGVQMVVLQPLDGQTS